LKWAGKIKAHHNNCYGERTQKSPHKAGLAQKEKGRENPALLA